MSDYSKGGRGKKAPYQTVHYRIPEPIKPTVEMLAEQYRQLATAQSVDEANEMLKRIQNSIVSNQPEASKADTKFVEVDLEQIVDILQEALKLKANAGGKIKGRIREVIYLIKNQ